MIRKLCINCGAVATAGSNRCERHQREEYARRQAGIRLAIGFAFEARRG
jgi:hypothetical protein